MQPRLIMSSLRPRWCALASKTPPSTPACIPQRAVELLVEEHAKHPHSPYLFVSPKTGAMFDPDSFRHTHEKILKAIGSVISQTM